MANETLDCLTVGSPVEIVFSGRVIEIGLTVTKATKLMVVLSNGSKWTLSNGTPWRTAYYNGYRWPIVRGAK